MGPPSYMRSVVDRNVVMRRVTVWDIRYFINTGSVSDQSLDHFLTHYFQILPPQLFNKSMALGAARHKETQHSEPAKENYGYIYKYFNLTSVV